MAINFTELEKIVDERNKDYNATVILHDDIKDFHQNLIDMIPAGIAPKHKKTVAIPAIANNKNLNYAEITISIENIGRTVIELKVKDDDFKSKISSIYFENESQKQINYHIQRNPPNAIVTSRELILLQCIVEAKQTIVDEICKLISE